MKKEQNIPAPDLNCIDCGKLITAVVGGVAICDDCLTVRGSCCPEFGAFDLTTDMGEDRSHDVRENASPVCYAPLFENGEDAAPDADSVQHDVARSRFHTASGAYLEYERTANGGLDVTHTFVPEDERGKGLAGRLMEAVVDHARREKLLLHASCSYAEAYLRRR